MKTSAFYSQKLQVGEVISGFARTLSKKRLKNLNIRENKLRIRQLERFELFTVRAKKQSLKETKAYLPVKNWCWEKPEKIRQLENQKRQKLENQMQQK